MNGAGIYWIAAWWFRLYWGAFCVILLVAAHLLWRRGNETRLMPRLRRVPHRLNGRPGSSGGIALVVFVATGIWIFYNTNILNHYRTSRDREQFLADYEKKYLKYEKLPQPTVSKVALNVALYPSRIDAVIHGSYALTNLTKSAIPEVHVRTDDDSRPGAGRLPGRAAQISRTSRSATASSSSTGRCGPARPRTMSFVTERRQDGFRNNGADTGWSRTAPSSTISRSRRSSAWTARSCSRTGRAAAATAFRPS